VKRVFVEHMAAKLPGFVRDTCLQAEVFQAMGTQGCASAVIKDACLAQYKAAQASPRVFLRTVIGALCTAVDKAQLDDEAIAHMRQLVKTERVQGGGQSQPRLGRGLKHDPPAKGEVKAVIKAFGATLVAHVDPAAVVRMNTDAALGGVSLIF
jgi:hypothetical protein